jgi:hypothetical protein
MNTYEIVTEKISSSKAVRKVVHTVQGVASDAEDHREQ